MTPADIADVVAGRRAPLLSVDNALYRRDAINEESIRRQTQRAESRNGVNAGVVTDSDDEEDFAEPLVDTTMLRRIASQNHYHVDLNNEREWELPRAPRQRLPKGEVRPAEGRALPPGGGTRAAG